MSDYCAFIPFVNRIDLLKKAVASASDLRQYLLVIDNSKEGLEGEDGDPQILRPSVPLTFSQTMNLILFLTRRARSRICIFMHSDAEAGIGSTSALVTEARKLVEAKKKWGVLFTYYDTLAAFNPEAFEDIGGWDTNLPWYFSDNDSYRRLRLAGWECIETGLPVKHEPSSTINSDDNLKFLNSVTFPLYESYYRRKWGGTPGNEIYAVPFNRELRT